MDATAPDRTELRGSLAATTVAATRVALWGREYAVAPLTDLPAVHVGLATSDRQASRELEKHSQLAGVKLLTDTRPEHLSQHGRQLGLHFSADTLSFLSRDDAARGATVAAGLAGPTVTVCQPPVVVRDFADEPRCPAERNYRGQRGSAEAADRSNKFAVLGIVHRKAE